MNWCGVQIFMVVAALLNYTVLPLIAFLYFASNHALANNFLVLFR